MAGGSGKEPSRSHHTAYQPPKTRQRVHKKLPILSVPNINDDATERKRVLNVLAQRRYRERKRLGRKAASGTHDSTLTEISETEPSGDLPPGPGPEPEPEPALGTEAPGPTVPACQAQLPVSCAAVTAATPPQDSSTLDGLNFNMEFNLETPLGVLDSLPQEDLLPSFVLDTASLAPFTQPATSRAFSTTVVPFALLNTPSPSDSPDSIPADSYLLPMSELTLLRAFLRIAQRLGCTASIWDLTAVSHFYSSAGDSPSDPFRSPPLGLNLDLDVDLDLNPAGPTEAALPSSSSPSAALPPNWAPTSSQMLIQHHPVLDFLPWPSVRDRIISIFSLPEEVRPENARGPLALVKFVYDVEDTAEGIRIWGGDPYDATAWEVGQVLFQRWWFVFDRDVIEQSNRWREMRGAAALSLTQDS